jgi:hypothetical protein
VARNGSLRRWPQDLNLKKTSERWHDMPIFYGLEIVMHIETATDLEII